MSKSLQWPRLPIKNVENINIIWDEVAMHCNGKMKEESGSFPAGTLTPQLFPHHPPPSHQLQLNLTLTPPFLHQLLTYPPMLEVYFISFQIVVCSLWFHISQCQPLCSLLFMNSVINSLQLRRLLQSTRRVITVQLNEGKHAAPANTNWNKIENTKIHFLLKITRLASAITIQHNERKHMAPVRDTCILASNVSFCKKNIKHAILEKIHIQNTVLQIREESSDARILKEASRSAESRKNPSQAKPWQVVAKSRQVWAFLDCILHWQTFQTASYNFPSSKYRRIQNKKN